MRQTRYTDFKVFGGATPPTENLSSPRVIGLLEVSAEDAGRHPERQELCPDKDYSIPPAPNPIQSPLKNYRRNPEYKPCTKIQALTHPLSPWPTVPYQGKFLRKRVWEAEVPGA